MLKKVLIANRGEIACRIIRTARRMGMASVAIYSDADAGAMHVRQADEAVHVGPSPALESYLVIDRIIAAARETGAHAIHPGYGFLAENADFADAVAAAGITFIGPSGDAMRALGGKAAAKDIAIKAGVPVIPGYQGAVQDTETLSAAAEKTGYPVMIKAVAGGGGRGMRLVEKAADFAAALEGAQREAKASFGDPRVLIEKLVVAPRHIEVQVFGDRHGNVVHLFERDCSLQRRNQKVVEEAPAPGMSIALREKMCAAAVKLAQSVGYEGAGTVEFLVEGGELSATAPWYFIEMNTRLQVEHPVTEEITGLDLVEWQLRVASGETLPLRQDQIEHAGHAIELRLCAEDPAKGFMPRTGRLAGFDLAGGEGIRIETGVETGDVISPFYDSMIAKIIARGTTRAAAFERLATCVRASAVAGFKTNGNFLLRLIEHPTVVEGLMDTGFIGREIKALTSTKPPTKMLARAIATFLDGRRPSAQVEQTTPWDAADGFQLGPVRRMAVPIVVDGKEHTFTVAWRGEHRPPEVTCPAAAARQDDGASANPPLHRIDDGARTFFVSELMQIELAMPRYDVDNDATADDPGTLRAPITGKVAKLYVKVGDNIAKGDRVAVVEAMKMEHVLTAARDGSIGKVGVVEGEQVTQGTLVATVG